MLLALWAAMHRSNNTAGFSLIEFLVVASLVTIMSGIGISLLTGWLPNARADAAERLVVYHLTAAREQALSERRNIEVVVIGDNQLQFIRHELPLGTTVLRTIPLESSVKFTLFDQVPDTPDGFGNSTPVDFGGANPVMFTSDGSMIDDQGVPVNGSIFLGLPETKQSARVVTVFGGTG